MCRLKHDISKKVAEMTGRRVCVIDAHASCADVLDERDTQETQPMVAEPAKQEENRRGKCS